MANGVNLVGAGNVAPGNAIQPPPLPAVVPAGPVAPIQRQVFPAGPAGDRMHAAAETERLAANANSGNQDRPRLDQATVDALGSLHDVVAGAHDQQGALDRMRGPAGWLRGNTYIPNQLRIDREGQRNYAPALHIMGELIKASRNGDRAMTPTERQQYQDIHQELLDTGLPGAENMYLPGGRPTYHFTRAHLQAMDPLLNEAGLSSFAFGGDVVTRALSNHRGLTNTELIALRRGIENLSSARFGRVKNRLLDMLKE